MRWKCMLYYVIYWCFVRIVAIYDVLQVIVKLSIAQFWSHIFAHEQVCKKVSVKNTNKYFKFIMILYLFYIYARLKII